MRPGGCVVRSVGQASRMKPKPKPQDDLSGCRTRGVEQRVPRRCGAAGHERLMKFVERRIPRCNRQRRNRPAELPSPMLSSQRAQQEKTEHKIFCEVRCLADEEVQPVKGFSACVRKQPVQYRKDEDGRCGWRKMYRWKPRKSRRPKRLPAATALANASAAALFNLVVRRFARDDDVVHVAFAQPCDRNPYEPRALL